MPVSRKDLMFDMRRRDEAEGESRMIGSGRREGFFERDTSEEALPAEGKGAGTEDCCTGRGRLRPRNISADLRTCEKSCGGEKKLVKRWLLDMHPAWASLPWA